VVFCANDHGFRHAAFPPVDYMVAMDEIEERLRAHEAPIVSPRIWADIRMVEGKPPVNNSGMVAAWVAWVMGCAPIILVGMDLYTAGTYFWDETAHSSSQKKSLLDLVQRWQRVEEAAPGIQLRPVNGPLCDVFPTYDPTEAAQPPEVDPKKLERRLKGQRLKFAQATRMRGVDFSVGEVGEFRNNEAMRLTQSKIAANV
jgi:hypothetical protein